MRKSFVVPAVVIALVGCGRFPVQFNTAPALKGSGNIVTQSRTVGEFDRVEVGGSTELTVTVEDKTGLTIETDGNLLEIIATEVRGRTLIISARESYSTSKELKVSVSTPKLEQITASGAAKVRATGVNASEFAVDLSGASQATVAGSAHAVRAKVSGAAAAALFDLHSENASLDASGAGKCAVRATGDLDANASGAGGITYKGEPKRVRKQISGAGTVESARTE